MKAYQLPQKKTGSYLGHVWITSERLWHRFQQWTLNRREASGSDQLSAKLRQVWVACRSEGRNDNGIERLVSFGHLKISVHFSQSRPCLFLMPSIAAFAKALQPSQEFGSYPLWIMEMSFANPKAVVLYSKLRLLPSHLQLKKEIYGLIDSFIQLTNILITSSSQFCTGTEYSGEHHVSSSYPTRPKSMGLQTSKYKMAMQLEAQTVRTHWNSI